MNLGNLWWQSIRGNGPEDLTSLIVIGIVTALLIPPIREWIKDRFHAVHQKIDQRHEELHAKLDAHHAEHLAEIAALHAKVDRCLPSKPVTKTTAKKSPAKKVTPRKQTKKE